MNSQEKQVEIGTEIIDSTLPSNLDFEQQKPSEIEGNSLDKGYKYAKQQQIEFAGDIIRSFTIKGKPITQEPQFLCGSIIKANKIGFQVKAYDQEKSGGLKQFWQSIVGYVKRQLFIAKGYIYMFQQLNDGYMTHSAWKLSQLFKIFVDPEEHRLRFIFRLEKKPKLLTKNFKAENYEEILQKIREQIEQQGLTITSE